MANRTGGGVILFGLNEETDFKIAVGDAHRLQEDLTSLASAEMEPALRPELTVAEIEGESVVCKSGRRRARKEPRETSAAQMQSIFWQSPWGGKAFGPGARFRKYLLESDASQNPPERFWQAGASGSYPPAGTKTVLEATFRDGTSQYTVALYERIKKR